jgi:ABC-2 type transport system permease protein
MTALSIARVNLLRMLRDRTGLFFVFLLPVILIVVLGTIYGGRVAPRLGIVAGDRGPLATDLEAALRSGDLRLEILEVPTATELRDRVERGVLEVGLVIPSGYDVTLRTGGTATITILGQQASLLSALREGVAAAVAEQSARIRAARLAAQRGDATFDAALVTARDIQGTLPGVSLAVATAGERLFPENAGAFALGAQSQLILFMFLTSMTAATQLILTRQLGVSRRMLSTPTSVATILAGETLGRFAVAMVQGLFIVVLSAAVFGVGWGDTLAAGLLVVAFALVGTGAAMVIGSFANNADQAGTVGVFAGMVLGALGGAMVPIEIFGEPLRSIAYLTPHAWAIAGLREVALRGGGIAQVLPQLGVLTTLGGVLLALGAWGLRRALTRG